MPFFFFFSSSFFLTSGSESRRGLEGSRGVEEWGVWRMPMTISDGNVFMLACVWGVVVVVLLKIKR